MKVYKDDPSKYFTIFEKYLMDRYQEETDWREVQDYILPKRGVFTRYTKPIKRKSSSIKAINTVATESLEILIAIMMGGLVSPTNPWFQLRFPNPELLQYGPLKDWLTILEKQFYTVYSQSSFYAKTFDMLKELVGFGTGYFYIGGDTSSTASPLRFESLTAGEAVIDTDYSGRVNFLQRILFKTREQLIERFGKDHVSERLKDPTVNLALTYEPILHTVHKMDKPTSLGFEYFSAYQEISVNTGYPSENKFLETGYYYSFPYLCPRYEITGAKVYGEGLGQRAMQSIKQLQEMEKAYLMATHKAVSPPLNAPARIRGKVKTLPGGVNYYTNPNEVIKSIYDTRFDFSAIMAAIDKKEKSIREIFYNDVLLSTMRDPNASPLRTGEVDKRSEEGLLRIGPVIESLHTEFLIPLIARTFDILAEKQLIEPIPPQFAEMVQGINVDFISILAQAQKLVKARPLTAFIQFVGGVAQFTPTALDKVDTDKIIEEYADVTGVPQDVVKGVEEVKRIRELRAQAQAAQQQRQMQLENAQMQLQAEEAKSVIAKNYSAATAAVQKGSAISNENLNPPPVLPQ